MGGPDLLHLCSVNFTWISCAFAGFVILGGSRAKTNQRDKATACNSAKLGLHRGAMTLEPKPKPNATMLACVGEETSQRRGVLSSVAYM